MALPKKLMTSPTRIVGADLGNTIPTKFGQLESALCDIFGFTPDADITESAFSLNNSGQITKQLVLQKAASPVGWRFRNTTNSKEMRIVLNGANLDFDENAAPGTEGTPNWVNRFRIAVSDGALTGAVFTTSTPGLAPASDGSSSKYLSADGTYSIPAAVTATSCRLTASGLQNVLNGAFTAISFDTETWDSGGMHSGAAPTRVTFPSAGKYVVIGQCGFAANATGRRIVDVRMNGSSFLSRGETDPSSAAQTWAQVMAIVNAAAADYIELTAWQNSGVTLSTVSGSAILQAYKIGG